MTALTQFRLSKSVAGRAQGRRQQARCGPRARVLFQPSYTDLGFEYLIQDEATCTKLEERKRVRTADL